MTLSWDSSQIYLEIIDPKSKEECKLFDEKILLDINNYLSSEDVVNNSKKGYYNELEFSYNPKDNKIEYVQILCIKLDDVKSKNLDIDQSKEKKINLNNHKVSQKFILRWGPINRGGLLLSLIVIYLNFRGVHDYNHHLVLPYLEGKRIFYNLV